MTGRGFPFRAVDDTVMAAAAELDPADASPAAQLVRDTAASTAEHRQMAARRAEWAEQDARDAASAEPMPCLLAGHDGPEGGCTRPATVEAAVSGGERPYPMCLAHALNLATATLHRGVEITLRPLGGAR